MSYRVITNAVSKSFEWYSPVPVIESNPIIFDEAQTEYILAAGYNTYLDAGEKKQFKFPSAPFLNHNRWFINRTPNTSIKIYAKSLQGSVVFYLAKGGSTGLPGEEILSWPRNQKGSDVELFIEISSSVATNLNLNMMPAYSYYRFCSGATIEEACKCTNQIPLSVYFEAGTPDDIYRLINGRSQLITPATQYLSSATFTDVTASYLDPYSGLSVEAYNRKRAITPGTILTFDPYRTKPVPNGYYTYSFPFVDYNKIIEDYDADAGAFFSNAITNMPSSRMVVHAVQNNTCVRIVDGVPLYNQPCNNGEVTGYGIDPSITYSIINNTYYASIRKPPNNTRGSYMKWADPRRQTINGIQSFRPTSREPFVAHLYYGRTASECCLFPKISTVFYEDWFSLDRAVIPNQIFKFHPFPVNGYSLDTANTYKGGDFVVFKNQMFCDYSLTAPALSGFYRIAHRTAPTTYDSTWEDNRAGKWQLINGNFSNGYYYPDGVFSTYYGATPYYISYERNFCLLWNRYPPQNINGYLIGDKYTQGTLRFQQEIGRTAQQSTRIYPIFSNPRDNSTFRLHGFFDGVENAGFYTCGIANLGKTRYYMVSSISDDTYSCFTAGAEWSIYYNYEDYYRWYDDTIDPTPTNPTLGRANVWSSDTTLEKIVIGSRFWVDFDLAIPAPNGRYSYYGEDGPDFVDITNRFPSDSVAIKVFEVVNGTVVNILKCPYIVPILKSSKRIDLCTRKAINETVFISANDSWIDIPNTAIYKNIQLTTPLEDCWFFTRLSNEWYENSWLSPNTVINSNYVNRSFTNTTHFRATNGKLLTTFNTKCYSSFLATSGSNVIRAYNSKTQFPIIPVANINNGIAVQPSTFQNIFNITVGTYLYLDAYDFIPCIDGYYFFSVGRWQDGYEIFHMVRILGGEGLIVELKNYSDFNEFFIGEGGVGGGGDPGGGGGTIPDQVRVYRTDDVYYAATVSELCRAELSVETSDDSYYGTVYHYRVIKNIGVELYADNQLSTPVPDGFYKIVDDSVIYKVKNGAIELFDICTSNYELFYGETKEDACSNIVKTNISSKTYGIIAVGDILYSDYDLKTIAPTGYYRTENYIVYHVTNGEIIKITTCPNEYFAYYGNSRLDVCEEIGDPIPIYMESYWDIDSKVYSDIYLTTPADDGYYKINHENVILVNNGFIAWTDNCYGIISLYPGDTEAAACDNNSYPITVFYKNTFDVGEFLYYDKFFITPVEDGYYKTGSDVYVIRGGKGEILNYKKCNAEIRLYFGRTIEETCYKDNYVDVYHVYDPFNDLNIETKLFKDYELTTPLSKSAGYYRYLETVISLNENGEINDIFYFSKCPEKVDMFFGNSDKNSCDSEFSITVYYTDNLEIDTVLYLNVEGTITVLRGYYRNKSTVYHVNDNGVIFYKTYCPNLLISTTTRRPRPIDDDGDGYCDHVTLPPPQISTLQNALLTTKSATPLRRSNISVDEILPFDGNIIEPTTTITTTTTTTTTTLPPIINNLNLNNNSNINLNNNSNINCSSDCNDLKH